MDVTEQRRLAIIGTAKNVGKTVTLRAILAAAQTRGDVVGVTSVGRDGEARDVIDPSIAKPRIHLEAGAFVATALPLLDRSPARIALIARTRHHTPLGVVAVGRMQEAGEVEVAGPGTAAGVAAVADLMLSLGATQVLIDGSLDRRAAADPAVSDGVVMATGAVLDPSLDEVVRRTAIAAALLRVPEVSDTTLREHARHGRDHLAVGPDGPRPLARELVLRSDARPADDEVALLRDARALIIHGALCEPFLQRVAAAREGVDAPLTVVVDHAAKVFVEPAAAARWGRRGIVLEARRPIRLVALTVNPVAPGAHRFGSEELCRALTQAVPGVAVLDVVADAATDLTRAAVAG